MNDLRLRLSLSGLRAERDRVAGEINAARYELISLRAAVERSGRGESLRSRLADLVREQRRLEARIADLVNDHRRLAREALRCAGG